MSVDTSISGSTCEIFPLTVRYVSSIWIPIALRKAKINHIYTVFCGITSTNKKIVRLNVSMNYSFFMNLLNSLDLYIRILTTVSFALPFKCRQVVLFWDRIAFYKLETDPQDWGPTDPSPSHDSVAFPWMCLYRRSRDQERKLKWQLKVKDLLLFPRSLWISLLSQKSITCF